MCDQQDIHPEESPVNSIYHNFRTNLISSDFVTKCRKCLINSGYVLLQKKDVFCATCLSDYCNHKFRSTIGKSRILGPGHKVLVGVSNSINSSVLVDFVKIGLSEDIHRKIRFDVSFVYVDECILCNEHCNGCTLPFSLFEQMYESGVDCYFTTLQNCLHAQSIPMLKVSLADGEYSTKNQFENVHNFLSTTSSEVNSFLKCFNSLRSLNLKQNFICRLRNLMLAKIAMENHFDNVFNANSVDELAVKLINNISSGRGMQIHSDMNFCDNRFGSVSILRPLREFASKEIAFYARSRNLNLHLYKCTMASKQSTIRSSLNGLTENFISHLQEQFPSTIYTIFKTGNKLTSSINKCSSHVNRCKFCLGQIDTHSEEYSAFDALRLTSNLSVGIDGHNSTSVEEQFCYSCSRIKSELDREEGGRFEQFCILSESI